MQKRRDFLANSAKFGLVGVAALSGLVSVSCANSASNSATNKATNSSSKGANLANSKTRNSASNATNSGSMPFVMLNNGVKMPILGLGTYGLRGNEGQKAMETAIKIGYRLIDTAQMYGNEAEVGGAVANSGVARDEFFITTKLSSDMSYDKTLKSFDESMKKLRLQRLDLLLIHSPYSNAKQMYKAMERLYKDGRISALGISNFNAKAYSDFVGSCEVVPAVNQCQTHIFYQQKPLRAAMQARGTILESWSPFVAGKNNFFKNETLLKIAAKHGKSVAQVALRFLIEQGIVVIPKSSNEGRLRENFSIFDFALDASDTKTLSAMDTNKSSFGWVD